MGSRFLPRLVNGPFDDPALFVPFRHQNRALLFDIGDIAALSSRDILKLSHIFVSHTHMDHFIGFDRVLRLLLGRDKELTVVGPQGFIDNLTGKLAGYCWNLVENYQNHFTLHAIELYPHRALRTSFACHEGFKRQGHVSETLFDGTLVSEPEFNVRAIHLDHGTPVLAFALEERFSVNIVKSALDRMGISPGPWLNQLKTLIYNNADPETMVELPISPDGRSPSRISMGELRDAIALIQPGQRMAYITDAAGSRENMRKMIELAKGVDILFVEAAFSHKDHALALEKRHLTARQAGELARQCSVRQFHVFHHSPRYETCPQLLEEEARKAFTGSG